MFVGLTINVLSLVSVESTDWEFSVGGLSGAITAWKIVDDETDDLIARNVLDQWAGDLNLGDGITIV